MKSTLTTLDTSDKTNTVKNGNVNIEHLQIDQMDISTKDSKEMFFFPVTCHTIILKEIEKSC